MNSPTTIELKNIDPEDIGDVLQKVAKSFSFQFGDSELKDVKTFGELCDITISKVEGDNCNDCTTQQAFDKVREAIAMKLNIEKSTLTVDTRLQELFPEKDRLKQIKVVESVLGFQTKVLRPKHWITTLLVLLLLAFFIVLFLYWRVGLLGLMFSIAGLFISDRLSREFDIKTLGELAEKIAREHYKQVRRNPAKINRGEITKKIKELFMKDLGLEENALTRETTFR